MMSPLEISAVVTSVLGIWLTTRRKLSSWPVILVSCVLYALVFRREKLYSDMLLQFVYFAFAIYGWWHWWRGFQAEGSVKVERLSARGFAAGMIIGTAGSFLLGYVMTHYTDAALPHIDAALTSFSLVAQFWATRKHIANWWLWIVVDALEIGVFLYKHLYLTAALFAFLIFLAIVGLRAWQKALREQESAGRDALTVPTPTMPADSALKQ
jgi:nicotinamide mononucleotide transporter